MSLWIFFMMPVIVYLACDIVGMYHYRDRGTN